jgi:3-deoxy-D-manno-octulosonic acid kinase
VTPGDDDPPSGFTRVERDGAVILLRATVGEALLDAGIHDPEALVARSPSPLRGRGRLARIDLGPAGRAIVRPLLRGGLLGRLIRRVSFDPTRAFAELRVSFEAAARGAHVLDVLAAVTRPAGLGWRHGLVTREVEGAVDLAAVLDAWPEPARRRALRAAGRAVRRLHDAGVDHVDLNLKNVLLSPAGEALVIDLDRCTLGAGPAPDAVRERNLLRLLRSWTKLGVYSPESVRRRDPLRLLLGYAPGRDGRPLRRRVVARGRGAGFGCRRVLWRLLGPPRPLGSGRSA